MKRIALGIAAVLGIYGYNVYTSAERDGTGTVVGAGSIDAFQIRVGDCFNDVAAIVGDQSEEVSSVPGVPCSEPHDNEVYAVFDVANAEFPGDDAIASIAFDSCLDRFATFTGRDYETSALDITTMYPSRDGWSQHSDREVICAVYDMNLDKLVGSVKGRGL